MGLDMYFEAEKYISGWDTADKADADYQSCLKMTGLPRCEDSPHATVRVNVGYWRKANAIHNWFVQNCQDGRDECQETRIDKRKLEELLKLCKEALAVAKTVQGEVQSGTQYTKEGVFPIMTSGRVITNPEEVAKILPTTSGFFFGSTEYDEWYLRQLERTVDMLEPLLKLEGFDFYYHASW